MAARFVYWLALLGLCAGCAAHRPQQPAASRPAGSRMDEERRIASPAPRDSQVRPVAHEAPATAPDPDRGPDDLSSLIATALASNPRLHQMQQEAAAAWERVRYVDELPDPEVGAMALVPPMHYADGRQVASIQFSQRIPWLKRLSAQEQEACFEAWALDSRWQAERLRIESEVKIAFYRLYVAEQQLRINRENRQLIELLINVATERVVAQAATEGDVLIGTLELSRLEEERFGLEERRASLQANLNRLLNRPAETPLSVPDSLAPPDPDWTLDTLRQAAWSHQPDIAAAQLRRQAAAWGITVAELERRPEITLNLDWMVMAPRAEPGMPAFGGDDTVQIGAMVSVPLWHEKYNAMRDEAVREGMARQFSLFDVQRQYEATLAELLERARAAARTVELYNSTVLPQARRTFEADQQAYAGPGTVDFDRVVEDFRTLLSLEESYHRAKGEWAIAVAQIEQAIAQDVRALPTSPPPVPAVEPDANGEPHRDGGRSGDAIELMGAEANRVTTPSGRRSHVSDVGSLLQRCQRTAARGRARADAAPSGRELR